MTTGHSNVVSFSKCCAVIDNLLMLASGESFKNPQLLFGPGRNTIGNLAAVYITL